jgi:succinate semialdehyde reductase (NADPH)
MDMMKAAVLTEAPGRLTIERIPVPQPLDGEVLVKVGACGVCHTDLHVMKAEVVFPTPAVLGHEISGTIVATGPGVTGLRPGMAVASAFIMPCGACAACDSRRDDLCEKFFGMNRLRGTLYDGTTRLRRLDGTPLAMYSMAGMAEYAVVPATDVFPLPDGVDAAAASVLGCAVFTGYGAVFHAANVQAGETVAVIATGGVGLNIIQLARHRGASRVIAVDVRDDKLDAARRLGATDVVNSATQPAVDRVRELTGGRGVDVAFEVLGLAQTFIQAIESLADGGRMVAVGIAPGRTTAPVEITRLVRRSLRMIGSYGARTRSDMPEILALAAAGVIIPRSIVTRTYSLDQADEAYQALGRGEIVGRAIIVP